MKNQIIILNTFKNELEKIAISSSAWKQIQKIPLERLKRLHAKTPVVKTTSGEHMATPFADKPSWQQTLGTKLPEIEGATPKTTYMRGGRETNIAKRRQQLYEHLKYKTPTAKAKRIGKLGLGAAGATAGIAGAGTIYGGLTMEPSIAASYSGEAPSIGPVYGGRYY